MQSESLVLWSPGVHKQFSLLGFTWLYDQNIVLSVYFEFLPIEDGSVPKQKNVNDFKRLWDAPVTHISKNHYYHTEWQQQKLMREQKAYCKNMARLWSLQCGDPSFVFVYCDIALELLRPTKALKCENFNWTVGNSAGFRTGYLLIWTLLLQISRMN